MGHRRKEVAHLSSAKLSVKIQRNNSMEGRLNKYSSGRSEKKNGCINRSGSKIILTSWSSRLNPTKRPFQRTPWIPQNVGSSPEGEAALKSET